MRPLAIVSVVAAGLACAAAVAQTMWATKGQPAVYKAPHKPHTKLKDLLAAHKGQSDWREVIVDDSLLHSEYVQVKPGAATRRGLHPDTRAWWVVMDGQVKFDIEGVGEVMAAKGSFVQVPMKTLVTYQAVGDKPALMFETNIAGAKTLYEGDTMPPKIPGFDWIQVRVQRVKGPWEGANKPHVTFDEMAKGMDEGKLSGTPRIVTDARGTANMIYGYNKIRPGIDKTVMRELPPLDPNNKGHYHPEGAEYWLIMKGQVRYPIEKVGVVIAEEGDVVYVPPFTWHAPRWWGEGPSCRLAMNGYPDIMHLFEPPPPAH